jgi:hypothetical protein
MAWGHEGSLWERSRAVARALLRGVTIVPTINLDPDDARGSIGAFAPEIVRPAVDATYAYDASGRAEIVPEVTGVRLDYAATTSLLTERIARFGSDPVSGTFRSPICNHSSKSTPRPRNSRSTPVR